MENQDVPAIQKPPPEQVAMRFVPEYYNVMIQKPEDLYKFYKEESVLMFGYEGENDAQVSKGLNEIIQKIDDLDYRGSKVRLSIVDAQPTLESGVLICVHGYIRKRDADFQKFSQTFILAEQPTGYFVKNDIFRYLDCINDSQGANVTVFQALKQESPPALPPVVPSIDHTQTKIQAIEGSKPSSEESSESEEPKKEEPITTVENAASAADPTSQAAPSPVVVSEADEGYVEEEESEEAEEPAPVPKEPEQPQKQPEKPQKQPEKRQKPKKKQENAPGSSATQPETWASVVGGPDAPQKNVVQKQEKKKPQKTNPSPPKALARPQKAIVKVTNIPPHTTRQMMMNEFQKFGEVNLKFQDDEQFAIIYFSDKEVSGNAVAAEIIVNGGKVQVDHHQPRKYNFGNGGNGNNNNPGFSGKRFSNSRNFHGKRNVDNQPGNSGWKGRKGNNDSNYNAGATKNGSNSNSNDKGGKDKN